MAVFNYQYVKLSTEIPSIEKGHPIIAELHFFVDNITC